MDSVIETFFMTAEVWVFLGILCLAAGIEDLIKWYKSKTVDNPTLK